AVDALSLTCTDFGIPFLNLGVARDGGKLCSCLRGLSSSKVLGETGKGGILLFRGRGSLGSEGGGKVSNCSEHRVCFVRGCEVGMRVLVWIVGSRRGSAKRFAFEVVDYGRGGELDGIAAVRPF